MDDRHYKRSNCCKTYTERIHKCRNKYRKCRGPTGPTGPQSEPIIGPTGATGPGGDGSQLFINNTVFVDQQFGDDTTGTRENEFKPFKTLLAALNVAIPGDVIYVHPGEYNENSLELRDNINWYFEEGASINNTTPLSIFLASNRIKSNIVGYGNFTSAQEILRITDEGGVTILFQGNNLLSTSGKMFDIKGKESSQLNIKGNIITSTGLKGGSIIDISGTANVNLDADGLISSELIINIPSSANGRLIVTSNAMRSTSASAVSIQSNSFSLELTSNLLVSNSGAYAIDINIPIVGPSSVKNKFVFQQVNITGGLLSVKGDPTVRDPLLSPEVLLSSQKINLTTNTVSPFYISSAIVNIYYDIFMYSIEKVFSVFYGENGGALFIDGKASVGTPLDIDPHVFLDLSNGIYVTCNSITTIMQFAFIKSKNSNLYFTGSFLNSVQFNTVISAVETIESSLVLEIENISIQHAGGAINSIETNGQFNLDFETMNINPSNVNKAILINHTGDLHMAGQYLSLNNGIFGINIPQNSKLCFDVCKVEAGNLDAFNIAGSMLVNSTQISVLGTGSGFIIDGSVLGYIGNLNVDTLNGNAIDMLTNGNIKATIENIYVQAGSLLTSITSGNIYLTAFNIIGNGGTFQGKIVGTFIDLKGRSNGYLLTNQMHANYYQTVIHSSADDNFKLEVQTFNVIETDDVVLIDGPNVTNTYLKWIESNVNKTLTNSFIRATNSANIYVDGGVLNINVGSLPNVFDIRDKVFLRSVIKYANNSGTILKSDTSNNVYYQTVESVTNGDTPLINAKNSGNIVIEGGKLVSNSVNGFNMIELRDNVNFNANIDNAIAVGTILYINNEGETIYKSNNSIAGNAVIKMEAPNSNSYVPTIGGYMKTGYNYAVETVGPSSYGGLRVLGSIIVSGLESIHNDPLLLPINVICQPSSATYNPTNVNIVPSGTLFVDPLVQ